MVTQHLVLLVKKNVKMARLSGGDPDQFVEDGATAPSRLPRVNFSLSVLVQSSYTVGW